MPHRRLTPILLALTLACLATTPLFALSETRTSQATLANANHGAGASTTMGPETADEVRRRRAQRQLEGNRRKQERDAEAVDVADLPDIDQSLVADYADMLAFIADPDKEGRIPGSRGIEMAAQYIESQLIQLGLTPAFDKATTAADGTEVITPNATFRQPMQMGRQTAAKSLTLTAGDTTFTPDADFSTVSYSGSSTITAPVSFVGYAIVSGPNNYLGFETNETIEGRIAICLNYEPMTDEGDSQWREEGWTHNSRITYKLSALQRRGAAGVILVSPPDANHERVGLLETIESTAPPSNRVGDQGGPEYDIPVIHARPEAVEALLEYLGTDLTLEQLTNSANDAGVVAPLGDKEITLGVELERTPRFTDNIGAVLPGRGALKNEYVVIGAHYDHVGYGKFGSNSPNSEGIVHPGADDNGTGTTANLIAAKALTQRYKLLADDQDARSILFLWFTAEESGLNGSKHYVEHPIAPLDTHSVMLNMDMIGSLSDGLLEIGGFDSGEGFEDLVTPHVEQAAIAYSQDVSVGSGRSDHASFIHAGVPALFFFTGLHERYHTPDDTADLIDNEGAVRVALLVSSIGYDAATRSQRVIHPSAKQDKPEKDGPNVRVGIIPSNSPRGGIQIERVFEDTSASAAGLRPGDRITKWDGAEIESVEAWMPIITAHEPGDVAKLEVVRDGQTIEVEMTLRPIE